MLVSSWNMQWFKSLNMTEQKKKISILGSTGSIGTSTLDICRQHKDKFEVVGLAAGTNMSVLAEQIREFQPQLVSVKSESEYNELKKSNFTDVEIVFGEEGAIQVATIASADMVMSAIVGAAGLMPTMKAIEQGKTIGLANKESMVIAGEIMSSLARQKNVKILPVDSEHSAIFQCLHNENLDDVDNLILTASGGPFFQKPIEEFKNITVEQALKHPNWDMGAKITIDSATMMNKGLEVMEAQQLFHLSVEKIKVVVHPQSIIHSMVEFIDGAVMAQMGEPDMREPIAFALSYPRRISTNIKKLDLPKREQLTFFEPDFEKFPCLRLAFEVAKKGGSSAPVLNAANEVLVDYFLRKKIGFMDIPKFLEKVLEKHSVKPLNTLDDVLSADQWSRDFTISLLE